MIRIALILCLVICAPARAIAQEFPEPISPYINDFAGVLSEDPQDRIVEILQALREDHGLEATLVTMNSKGDYAEGVALEDFATALFNQWGIGDAERNDGILLLYLHQDREVRVELGQAYGRDWDHWAGIVVDDFLVPNFRAGRVEVGLVKGVASIRDEIALPFLNGEDAPRKRARKIAVGNRVSPVPPHRSGRAR